MNSASSIATREIFLVLDELCARHSLLSPMLAALEESSIAKQCLQVDALYWQSSDRALLCLHFLKESLGEQAWFDFVAKATTLGLIVLNPTQLSQPDYQKFYDRLIPSCQVRVDKHRSVSTAMIGLFRVLGLEQTKMPPPPPVAQANKPAANIALSLAKPKRSLPLAKHKDVAFVDEVTGLSLGPAGAPFARGKDRQRQRAQTVPARPASRQRQPPRRLAKASNSPLPAQNQPRFAKSDSDELETPQIDARFQRGDSWKPARLRNLTIKEVRLAASAAPPIGVTLRVEVGRGSHRVDALGTVIEVVNAENSPDGSTSFRLQWCALNTETKESLVALLRSAKSDGVQLSPPPPRRSRRFALSWPVQLRCNGKMVQADALDISDRGLFVATRKLMRAESVDFGIVLEGEREEIRGNARVARQVSVQMAKNRGLSAGYGLYIQTLQEGATSLYTDFLQRVKNRNQRHLMVAAPGMVGQEIAGTLESLGYAVTHLNDFDAIGHLHSGVSKPDLALVDSSSLDRNLLRSLEAVLDSQGIAMLQIAASSKLSMRQKVDRLLQI